MDKYEYKVRYDQIKKLYDEEKYSEAAKVADTVDWRKVKDWLTLAMVINIYEVTNQLEDAKNVCVLAYNRKLGGKRLIYKLCDLLIKTGDFKEATEVYEEFVAKAPKDLSRYALQYQLYTAKGASTDKLISILQEYNELDRDEYCLNEMAMLYEKSGQIEKCMQTCDDIILWFNGGDFYEDALKLKRKYGALTHNQKLMLEHAESLKEKPLEAKRRNVTLELPRGVLTANDIIKVATGEINTSEINKAYEAVTSNAELPVSEPVKPLKTEEIVENAEIAKEEPKVKLPDMTINKKERPVSAAKSHKPLKFLNFLSKSEEEEKAPQIELPVIPELEKKVEEEEEKIPVISEEAVALDNEIPENELGEVDIKNLTHTQALRFEQEVLKEESRIIGQEPVLDPDFEEAKSNTVKITIPDYANYDTVNIQKEIAENIKPYLDAYEEEKEPFAPAVFEGDIITTDEGVFRVTSNDSRFIKEGINYDLEPVTEEELLGNAKEETPKKKKQEEVLEPETEKEDLSKTVRIDTKAKYPKTQSGDNFMVAPTINISGVLSAVEEALEETEKSEADETIDVSDALSKISEDIAKEVATSENLEEEERSLEDIAKDVAREDAIEEEKDLVKEQTQAINKDEIENELSSYKAEEDAKETVVDDSEVILKSHTQAISASIQDSLNKVEQAEGEQVSAIFESTLTDDEEERIDYDAFFEEIFIESFGKYANLKGIKKQVFDCVEKMKTNVPEDTTSRVNNVVIAGNKSIKKTDVAIALVRLLNVIFPDNKRKIAKTSAGNLNKRGLAPVFNKLKGSALIIDEASELSEEMVVELTRLMNEETDHMLVILTDNENKLLRFLGNHNKLSSMFDNLIEIRKYNVNELVEMAKEYADSKNCSINDKALLKLYLVIDKMNSDSESTDINMLHSIIDDAIEKAKDRIAKGFFSKIRKPSEGGPISLKEADFEVN